MAHVKGDAIGMRFTPDTDGNGGGWLEWDDIVVRKGFRPKRVHRKIRKEPMKGEEIK